ncbi:MAG: hypothetical protein AAGK98_05710 [Pseudomonadota bacterium]
MVIDDDHAGPKTGPQKAAWVHVGDLHLCCREFQFPAVSGKGRATLLAQRKRTVVADSFAAGDDRGECADRNQSVRI